MLLQINKDQLLVIWNALQQFVDNSADDEAQPPREAQEAEIAQGLVDQIDAVIATPAKQS